MQYHGSFWVKPKITLSTFNEPCFQRLILKHTRRCDARRCPSSTQSYTALPLTLNHVKAWLTERQIQGLQRQIQGLQQRVWERDRETNPGAPAGLRERQKDKSRGSSSGFERGKTCLKKKFIYFWSKLQIQLNLSFLGQISTKIYLFLFFLIILVLKKSKFFSFLLFKRY